VSKGWQSPTWRRSTISSNTQRPGSCRRAGEDL
jgi:hypothetical protein